MTPENKREYRFCRIEISAFRPCHRMPGGLRIEWGAEDIGFGELVLYASEDGRVTTHNETMSRDFVVALLAELGRRITLEDGPDGGEPAPPEPYVAS